MAYYCRDGGEYRPNADAKHAARVTVTCGRTECGCECESMLVIREVVGDRDASSARTES